MMVSFATDQCISPIREVEAGRMTRSAYVTSCVVLEEFGLRLVKTTVVDGLTPMPDGVYTVEGSNFYVHPDGSVRPYYSPAES